MKHLYSTFVPYAKFFCHKKASQKLGVERKQLTVGQKPVNEIDSCLEQVMLKCKFLNDSYYEEWMQKQNVENAIEERKGPNSRAQTKKLNRTK